MVISAAIAARSWRAEHVCEHISKIPCDEVFVEPHIVEFSPMSCALCGAQLSENGTALAHMAAHLRTLLPHGDVWSSNHLCLRVRYFSLNAYMPDSRRVLCSFDCDSAQSFLASQMENWQRTIAATQPERPTKVRRNSNATGSKDDLERQLLLISIRLGLRNARVVPLLNSICYSTVKL